MENRGASLVLQHFLVKDGLVICLLAMKDSQPLIVRERHLTASLTEVSLRFILGCRMKISICFSVPAEHSFI